MAGREPLPAVRVGHLSPGYAYAYDLPTPLNAT